MSKVLVVNASVMPEENSVSQEIGKRFIVEYLKNNPQDEIINLNLNEASVGLDTLSTNRLSTFWSEDNGMKYINLLKSIDKVLVLSPMYNLHVSSLLKNFIDHIFLVDQTFSYKLSKDGKPVGMLTNLKVQNIVTQGSFDVDVNWSHIIDYVEGVWTFLGAKACETILLDGISAPENYTKTIEEKVDLINQEIIAKAKAF